ncbi:MAG: polyphosphate kinase 1 [Candidatus Sericytochromatia bacterium]|nr:polyphosphate kinase 1 [Candidatus Sericytochromatia bacterium]
MTPADADAASWYLDEELSWLAFNERVIEEATDPANPLLERVKFAAIAASNLDEFFAVRVAQLRELTRPGHKRRENVPHARANERLQAVSQRTHQQVALLYEILQQDLLPRLEAEGIRFFTPEALPPAYAQAVEAHFLQQIQPVLTPMAVDASRPFPLLANKRLNLAVMLRRQGLGAEPVFAVVQVPPGLPRTITLRSDPDVDDFILLEDVIQRYLHTLFAGYDVLSSAPFRITRKADLSVDESGAEDLLEAIQAELKKRRKGEPVRLEIAAAMSPELEAFLLDALEVEPRDIYRVSGPLDPTFLMSFSAIAGYEDLRFDELKPVLPSAFGGVSSIFEAIARQDILVHHPYESFESVLHFIREAAEDPGVLAIKQTLYRVSGSSPVVAALARAAEMGKQVTVLVELKARFDEENNIAWAKRLEEAGCHVIYGLVGLKTHCKVTLVVRREGGTIKRYMHFGTGNYNDQTARVYTDVGLFTANDEMGADASHSFNHLSGYAEVPHYQQLALAPERLRETLLDLVHEEVRRHTPSQPGYIRLQMNALTDMVLINALYAASQAGVRIDLLIRGICALRPGVPGLSEHIRVFSMVGRFLEHCRIFHFRHGGEERYYISSADWRRRNMDHRVELLVPILQPDIRERLRALLDTQFADTVKMRELTPDGTYVRRQAESGAEGWHAQARFLALPRHASERAPKRVERRQLVVPWTPPVDLSAPEFSPTLED